MKRALATICTGNSHKVAELNLLLPEWECTALAAGVQLPPETGDTFEENALIKARAGRASADASTRWVVADDSGLEVDALDGRPGVYSARFAGEAAADEQNVELLLQQLLDAETTNRSARFVCVLAAIRDDGFEITTVGAVAGSITDTPRGSLGFGYDPVFVPNGFSETFAELGNSVKQKHSHRAAAARALRKSLSSLH